MMQSITKDPSPVSFSLSLYQFLLTTYPAGFRREYGPHMAQVFRDYCLRVYRLDGLPGMLRLWILTLLDYLKSVVEEHLQQGVHMSKSKFIRLSGWALVLGAITFMVTILIQSRDVPEYSRYNYLSSPIDLYFEYAVAVLFPASMFLLVVGMVGLYLRYREDTNSFGRFSLILGTIGGVSSFLTILAGSLQLEITESGAAWFVFIAGFTLYFLSLVFFGFAAIRDDILPRWNGIPIIAGIWVPLMILLSELSGTWEINPIIEVGVVVLTTIGLIALGVLLGSDSPEMATAT